MAKVFILALLVLSLHHQTSNTMSKQVPYNFICKCVDDTRPDMFQVEDWVERGHVYIATRVGTNDLNGDLAAVLVDMADGHVVRPHDAVPAINITSGRFVVFQVYNN